MFDNKLYSEWLDLYLKAQFNREPFPSYEAWKDQLIHDLREKYREPEPIVEVTTPDWITNMAELEVMLLSRAEAGEWQEDTVVFSVTLGDILHALSAQLAANVPSKPTYGVDRHMIENISILTLYNDFASLGNSQETHDITASILLKEMGDAYAWRQRI